MDWIEDNLVRLREVKPLVHNITNFVVMNTTANALLALGASPVMAHAPEELEDMIKIADSLVINIGTLDKKWVESMEMAIEIAYDFKKPIVLDPVGAGATRYRTNIAKKLIDSGKISVIRGNFSEIKALIGEEGDTKGVDAIGYNEEIAQEIAIEYAKKSKACVALTGPVDYVTDGSKIYRIENGTSLLSRVTGTGCMVTSIIGAFLGVSEPLKAAVSGLVVFNIAAEKAEEETSYPGSFHIKLYDWLYRIDNKLIASRRKVEEYVVER